MQINNGRRLFNFFNTNDGGQVVHFFNTNSTVFVIVQNIWVSGLMSSADRWLRSYIFRDYHNVRTEPWLLHFVNCYHNMRVEHWLQHFVFVGG